MRAGSIAIFALGAIALASCSGGGSGAPPTESRSGRAQSARSVDAPFNYSVHPHVRRISDLLTHNCPGGTVCSLAPATLRTAYDFQYQAGTEDGTGQTIVIVDPFGSPTIAHDLQFFSNFNNLPLASTQLSVIYPGGKPTVNVNNANQLGWAEETTLDVEWAHASAPGAKLVLVVGNNDQGQTIQSTIQYAISNYPGSAVSLSFGVQESSINGGANNTQLTQSAQIYTDAANIYHDTVIASAGDLGSSGGTSTANAQYPASDPHVLGVGGTNLTLFHNGRYRSESAWNDGIGCAQPCGATGGAPSTIFSAATVIPNQTLLTGDQRRNTADVAFAAADQAVAVYMSFVPHAGPGWFAVGGTSVGPPAYAGIIAIANQMRANLASPKQKLGFVTNALYGQYTAAQLTTTAPFHDVSGGNNIFTSGVPCCNAGSGYDNPTGLGTPDINNLLNVLVNLIP